MSMEATIDVWAAIKHLVPKNNRQEAAEALVSTMDEYGLCDGIENSMDLDRSLRAAVVNHFGEIDDDLEEEDWI